MANEVYYTEQTFWNQMKEVKVFFFFFLQMSNLFIERSNIRK